MKVSFVSPKYWAIKLLPFLAVRSALQLFVFFLQYFSLFYCYTDEELSPKRFYYLICDTPKSFFKPFFGHNVAQYCRSIVHPVQYMPPYMAYLRLATINTDQKDRGLPKAKGAIAAFRFKSESTYKGRFFCCSLKNDRSTAQSSSNRR